MNLLLNPDFWNILTSISTVLGFGIIIYATFLALGQLKEMTRARHLEAMIKVYDMIGSEDARSQRRFLYTKIVSPPETLSPDERQVIEQVTITFDQIGKLIEAGLVPKEELFDSHCEVILRSWKIIKPYVLHNRATIGGRHANHFERMATDAQEYYSEQFPEQILKTVNLWESTVESKDSTEIPKSE